MPRNYDEIRDSEDLSFVIRGETFEVRRVPVSVLERLDALQKEFLEGSPDTYAASFKFSQDRLLMLIDDRNGAVDRWQALVARDEDPVTYGEVLDVSRWAFEKVTGLPTMPPSPSAPSPGSTKATSKAG